MEVTLHETHDHVPLARDAQRLPTVADQPDYLLMRDEPRSNDAVVVCTLLTASGKAAMIPASIAYDGQTLSEHLESLSGHVNIESFRHGRPAVRRTRRADRS